MASLTDSDIPQWKKDLIARLRSQNKRTASVVERQQQQLYGTSPPQQQSMSVAVGRAVQQPSLTCLSEPVAAAAVVSVTSRGSVEKCNASSTTCRSNKVKMVQERPWEWSVKTVDDDKMIINGDGEFKSDSDSSEDLQYGPGIVNKLKEKYLNLALREANSRMKPAISMRKAASLENILDDKISEGPISGKNRLYQTRLNGSNDTTKNVPNRYRNTPRGTELKRARSVEAISRAEDDELMIATTKPKRESLHEEMLINNDKRGNDKYTKPTNDNNCKMLEPTPENKPYTPRKNRPKRVVPIMNEREKPPADVVKQHKLIFEKNAENRTKAPQQTGDVAAKVATFTNIISEQKTGKKPPIKTKPVIEKSTTNGVRIPKPKSVHQDHNNKESNAEVVRVSKTPSLPSPIPDISRIDFPNAENECGIKTTSLSETPDLIMTSSPLVATIHSPTFRISATENFIKEEILHSNNANNHSHNNGCGSSLSPPIIMSPKTKPVSSRIPDRGYNEETASSVIDGVKRISRQSLININNASNTMTYNFANNSKNSTASILSTNKNILNTRTPPSQPLKVEINGVNNSIEIKSPNLNNVIISPTIKSPSPKPKNSTTSSTSSSSSSSKPNLTTVEIEKNLKNSVKLQEQQKQQQPPNICVIVKSDNEVTKNVIPKVKKSSQSRGSEPENNSIVFKFTHRKDVPDYVHNEGSNRCVKIEKPKVGEGGIILLPGATIDFTDDDDDEIIMRSLEGPPSPCDVIFINDNILIDGKSSLSQKRKKAKMKITFLEEGPEVFEYPSETSMLTEETPANAQMGHTVPSLTGSSSLANYTPKGTGEDFQPGVTRTNIPISGTAAGGDAEASASEELIQAEEPILFSAGTNSDILF